MKITKTFQFEEIQGFKFGSWPFGKPRMFSHAYFVDGLLIDTGHHNVQKEVLERLKPLPVKQIFLTHHHEDHTGNLKALQQHFQCPTYASPQCIELMKNPPNISFAQWLTWGRTQANFEIKSPGKQLITLNYRFDIIPIPGHAVDMVCLYEANKGWLFSADLWVAERIRYFMRSESIIQQINSIKKVLKLDFEALLCSHRPQFKGGKKKLQSKLEFMENFYEQASTLYQKGYNVSQIVKKMKLKEDWRIWLLSTGALSAKNMVNSVIRDEKNRLSTLETK